jgi:hypothetical protein
MRCQQKSYVVGETVVVGQRSNTRIFTSGGVVSADGRGRACRGAGEVDSCGGLPVDDFSGDGDAPGADRHDGAVDDLATSAVALMPTCDTGAGVAVAAD